MVVTKELIRRQRNQNGVKNIICWKDPYRLPTKNLYIEMVYSSTERRLVSLYTQKSAWWVNVDSQEINRGIVE